jgi:hypothetical protein
MARIGIITSIIHRISWPHATEICTALAFRNSLVNFQLNLAPPGLFVVLIGLIREFKIVDPAIYAAQKKYIDVEAQYGLGSIIAGTNSVYERQDTLTESGRHCCS